MWKYLRNRYGTPCPKEAIPSRGRCHVIFISIVRVLKENGFSQKDIYICVANGKLPGHSLSQILEF
jgi:hypothetical protein